MPPEAIVSRPNRFGKNKIFKKNDREAGLEPKGWFRSCFLLYVILIIASPGQMTFLTSLQWITMRKKKRRDII